MRWIGPFLLGAAAVLAAEAVGGALYLGVGGYNVAASEPHNRITFGLTHAMMEQSVRRNARGIRAPATFTAAQVADGFRIYDARCVACHGAPAIDSRWRWADGLTPSPPYLIEAAHDWSPAELFWTVKHGVKMTGMPAWERACTDAQIWDVVAFLEALPRMGPTDYRDWKAAQAQRAGAAGQTAPPPAAGCA